VRPKLTMLKLQSSVCGGCHVELMFFLLVTEGDRYVFLGGGCASACKVSFLHITQPLQAKEILGMPVLCPLT